MQLLVTFQVASLLKIHAARQLRGVRVENPEPGERGRGDIVMQIQEVETTQKRDEPEGSIALVFHRGPESIWLKIKAAGLCSDRVAFTEDRAGQVSHQMRLPLSNLCLFVWKRSCCLPNRESVLYSRSLIPAN